MKTINLRIAGVGVVIACFLMLLPSVSAQSYGVNVQNLSVDPANTVNLAFYDPAGTLVYTHVLPAAIPGNGVANVYVPGISSASLPLGSYSVVISSDQPVQAVVNMTDTTNQRGDSYIGSDPGAMVLYCPLWYRNYSSYNSKLYLQNASGATQNITADFYLPGNAAPTVTQVYSVAAYATQVVDLTTAPFAALDAKYGSAKVTGASGDIAVVAAYDKFNAGVGVNSSIHGEYRGIRSASAGKNLICPLVYQGHSGWASGIMLVNTENVGTTVTIEYTASPLSAVAPWTASGSIPVPASSSVLIYPPLDTLDFISGTVPNLFFGTVKFTSTITNILAVANGVKTLPSGSAIGSVYEAFSTTAATSKIVGPLAYRNHSGNETGIQVMNVGGAPTDITLTFTKADTSTPTDSGVPVTGPWTFTKLNIPANGSTTFYLPSEAGMANIALLYGAITIQSTGGVPIVAVINSTRNSAGLSANYIGINQ